MLRPAPDDFAATGPCPRCGVSLFEEKISSGAVIHRCRRCDGVFVPPRAFCALLEAPDTMPEWLGKPSAFAELDDPISCATCGRQMKTTTFGHWSGVTVDVCEAHGLWLDGGELAAVLAYIEARERRPTIGFAPRSTRKAPDPQLRRDLSGKQIALIGGLAAIIAAAATCVRGAPDRSHAASRPIAQREPTAPPAPSASEAPPRARARRSGLGAIGD